MTFPARLLCLALLLAAPFAHAWDRPEMSKYGAAYRGPEQLYVHVAHNKADDRAVVRIFGINHPLDGHTYWTRVAYAKSRSSNGFADRATYSDTPAKGQSRGVVLFIEDVSGTLYLPNYRGEPLSEIPLQYDREASREVTPEHMMTDYERQIGVTK